MKKGLVILLSFLILTNFHCARFDVRTVDANNRLSSCPATLVETSDKSPMEKNGTFVLSEKAVLFYHQDVIEEIPYSQIDSLDFHRLDAGSFTKPVFPSFSEGGRSIEGANLTTALIIGFFSAALLLYLIFGTGSKNRRSVQLDIYFTVDKASEMSAFKMTGDSLAKIYPLLLEKID